MTALIYKFVQIALLRATPQDLPAQAIVLWLSMAMAAITGVLGLLISYDVIEAFVRTIAALAVPAVFLNIALTMKQLRPRFLQAYSAICGTSAVVYAVALPFLPAFFEAVVATQQGKLIVYFILLLDVWAIIITAHILRHTFDTGMTSGVSMAVALMILTIVIVEIVSPVRSSSAMSPQAATDTLSEHFEHELNLDFKPRAPLPNCCWLLG